MPIINPAAIYPSSNYKFPDFPSRRSVVHSTEGIVACTQPLAAKCALEIFQKGGNAADAAVAVAAGLNMTEPCSTGIGGDMFCIYYDAKTKKVSSLNGSGRAPARNTLDTIRKDLGIPAGEVGEIPMNSVHAVTVPGAAAGWVDCVERFGSGRVTLEEILAPAIKLGEDGFPVHEIASISWINGEADLRNASPNFAELLKADPKAPDGYRAPGAGEIMKNPNLANTFRTLAQEGKKGFYTGRIAESVVQVCNDLGGHIQLEDLKEHMEIGTQDTTPISLKFNGFGVSEFAREHIDGANEGDCGVEVWEHPPNGQGIVALMALGILEELEASGKIPTFTAKDHNTAPYLHAIIESLRIAFADAAWWVTDPDVTPVPTAGLLARTYLAERARLFSAARASPALPHGSPAQQACDTVYFAVSDADGNGISFINSNYAGFGTAIVPPRCGFTLQNRGANFSLAAHHANRLAPRKRPYHTIIPAIVTNAHDGSLHSLYGVMGGFMQPQGHVQVLLNMLVARLTPQAALDAPRVCVGAPDGAGLNMVVFVEEGISEEVLAELVRLGHRAEMVRGHRRGLFGRGQVIRCHEEEGRVVWSAGSDPRGDGAAYPV